MVAEKVKKIKGNIKERSIENAIRVASELIDELNINNVPVPIVKILNELGFAVYASDMPKQNISGFIIINPELNEKFNTDRVIAVERSDTLGRQRFTLAHEFAHYLFDFNENISYSYIDTYDQNKAEDISECIPSRFAAEFLMPKRIFISKYNELNNLSEYEKVSILMKDFDVSQKSVLKRIEELRLNNTTGNT
ncbi:MAG: ImmA/IrrE family metallo-endopeptidase [Oscillospiraceae bacterium]|nr:ImmA/IrrE family metallo-endopeptidase [Oscillospiraceae bacterium]